MSFLEKLVEPRDSFAWSSTFTILAMLGIALTQSPDQTVSWILAHLVLAAMGTACFAMSAIELRTSRRNEASPGFHFVLATVNTLLCVAAMGQQSL